ncbi:putative heat shock protein 70 family, peptide-binding domain protein, partial [Tanacetum coccineum]
RTAVGIDLGTTYYCVAAWFDKHNRVEMIPNEQGNKITPSCVAWDGTQILVGEAAKNQINRNPKNTVFDVKRLMGSGFNDSKVHEDIKSWPFKVIEGSEGKPLFVFEHESQEKKFSPQDISALILKILKETAEAYLGTKVTDGVITVPAYFNNEANDMQPRGAKRFDVSLLNISKDGTFTVRAVGGDTHLGGEDFDKMMCIEHVESCLRDGNMNKIDVDDVVIVGGSTRIPKVQQMLMEFFGGKALCKSINADEAVAYGAAVLAANLSGLGNKKVKDLIPLDVTPLSLGIRVRGDIMSVVIPKNTRIPAMKKRVFETSVDNHTSANFCVFEGESKDTNENTMLGSFVIHGIPAAPEGNKTSITIKDKKCMIIEEKKNKSTRTDQDKGDTWIDNLIRKILRTKSNHQ